MYRNKLILTALSSVLLLGAAAGASFAAPGDQADHPGHHGKMEHGMMGGPRGAAFREILFVRMLKQFDTNKDGQITKQEATDGMEKIFAAIDTNHDGSLTPGEIRAYREAQFKARREAVSAKQGDADQNAAPQAGDDKDHGRHGHDGHHWMHGNARFMAITMMMGRIDTDQNGQISKQEAETAFNKFFDRMDRNKDGVISIDDMPDQPFL
jgi:Ca2+-binding EF-hand superfamily protein